MIGTALVAATIGIQLVEGSLSLQAGLTVLMLAPELYGPLREVGQQFHASTDASTAQIASSRRSTARRRSPVQAAPAVWPAPPSPLFV